MANTLVRNVIALVTAFGCVAASANWRGSITCPLPAGQTCQVAIFTYDEDGSFRGLSNFPLESGASHDFAGAAGTYATWCYAEDGNIPARGQCDERNIEPEG